MESEPHTPRSPRQPQMSNLNAPNSTLTVMDNLTFLRSINNECIDLIAIDPLLLANPVEAERSGENIFGELPASLY